MCLGKTSIFYKVWSRGKVSIHRPPRPPHGWGPPPPGHPRPGRQGCTWPEVVCSINPSFFLASCSFCHERQLRRSAREGSAEGSGMKRGLPGNGQTVSPEVGASTQDVGDGMAGDDLAVAEGGPLVLRQHRRVAVVAHRLQCCQRCCWVAIYK